jgi:prepilin-type processing-associated H-X9-DG protein
MVTIGCVLVVLAIFLPALARPKARTKRISCVNCLRQVGLSFRLWAEDNNNHYPMQVSVTNGGTMELVSSGLVFPHFRVMSNELSTPRILYCPEDKNRTYATSFAGVVGDTNLSYFINVDAVEGDGSSLLCGDRNLRSKPWAGSRFVCLSSTSVIGWDKQMHREKGNLCFADGSVVPFANGAVGPAVRMPVGVTNRLAVP